MIRTAALEADLAADPDAPDAATVVAIPPSDTSPAPFIMAVYVNGQLIGRAFDPTLVQP